MTTSLSVTGVSSHAPITNLFQVLALQAFNCVAVGALVLGTGGGIIAAMFIAGFCGAGLTLVQLAMLVLYLSPKPQASRPTAHRSPQRRPLTERETRAALIAAWDEDKIDDLIAYAAKRAG